MFLTTKQLDILNFIREFIHDKQVSPTLGEMSQYFDVSKVTVYEHVKALEKKGAIRKMPNMARSITLVEDDPLPSIATLPIKGKIAAGAAIEAIPDEDTFSLTEMAPAGSDTYILQVEGESMINDHICDGDLVLVEPADTARDGQIVVALLPDEDSGGRKVTLKRFYREGDHVRLQPANDTMDPIRVKNPEIQGRVVGVIRPSV